MNPISPVLIHLEPLRTEQDFKTAYEGARDDDHSIFAPSFKVVKNKQLQGYVSLGTPGYPVCVGWLSKKDVKRRDGLTIMHMVENHVYVNGARGIVMPMPECSPFHKLMPELGYRNGGRYDFFVKEF